MLCWALLAIPKCICDGQLNVALCGKREARAFFLLPSTQAVYRESSQGSTGPVGKHTE